MRATSALGILALASFLLASCGGGENGGGIKVFAASSLTAAFEQIGKDFEAAHEGVSVTFNFGGSPSLRTQLEQGAEADVFASADVDQMGLAIRDGVIPEHDHLRILARNRLTIIVPKANQADIRTPADLAERGLKIVLANEDIPAGKYARAFLDAASLDPTFGAGYKDAVLGNVVSEASNVKEVVSAVQLGEADAGIVYVTDVTEDVAAVDIPESVNQVAEYPIALTSGGASNANARAFIDYVLGEEGQATLASFGFREGGP